MKSKLAILVVLAFACCLVAGFGVTPVGAQQAEGSEGARLYVSPATVMELQKQLLLKGFNVGPIDGKWGDATSQAVKKYQQVQGLEPTGNLNLETLDFVGISEMLRQNPPTEDLQVAGKVSEGAPLFISPSGVRQIQQQLSASGYDPGPIDGLWGPNTREAVRQFEKKNNMTPSGNINVGMLNSLGLNQMVAVLTRPGEQQMAQAQGQQQQQQVRGYYGPQGEKTSPEANWQQRSGREGFISVYGRERQSYAGEGAPLFASADMVKQIEQKLNQAGFQVNADGNWDNQSSQAVRNYQQANQLEPTGNLNLRTMDALLGGLSAEMLQGGGQGQQPSR